MSLDGPLAQRAVLWIFFALLAAFTLATGDGGTLAPLLISAPLLLTAAVYFAWGVGPNLRPSFPVVCLAAVAVYGVLQTLLLRNVIAYLGWSGVLFWFTALAITALAECLFRSPAAARNFRAAFILFGTAVCLLDGITWRSLSSWFFPSRSGALSAAAASPSRLRSAPHSRSERLSLPARVPAPCLFSPNSSP
jgi:hypothetical protein